jgi:hypothetical protein
MFCAGLSIFNNPGPLFLYLVGHWYLNPAVTVLRTDRHKSVTAPGSFKLNLRRFCGSAVRPFNRYTDEERGKRGNSLSGMKRFFVLLKAELGES